MDKQWQRGMLGHQFDIRLHNPLASWILGVGISGGEKRQCRNFIIKCRSGPIIVTNGTHFSRTNWFRCTLLAITWCDVNLTRRDTKSILASVHKSSAISAGARIGKYRSIETATFRRHYGQVSDKRNSNCSAKYDFDRASIDLQNCANKGLNKKLFQCSERNWGIWSIRKIIYSTKWTYQIRSGIELQALKQLR